MFDALYIDKYGYMAVFYQFFKGYLKSFRKVIFFMNVYFMLHFMGF